MFKSLDKIEFELKQIWTRANAASGNQKQALLNEYKAKHEVYRKTKARLLS